MQITLKTYCERCSKYWPPYSLIVVAINTKDAMSDHALPATLKK